MIDSPKQKGSSLIEVLIALFVLAIGMLGVLAMQANAVKTARDAGSYSKAESLLLDIYETMRMTREADRGDFLINFDDPAPERPSCLDVASDCDGEDMVDWAVHNWRLAIESNLPSGEGQIQRDNETREYTISIRFSSGYEEDATNPTSVTATSEEVDMKASFGEL